MNTEELQKLILELEKQKADIDPLCKIKAPPSRKKDIVPTTSLETPITPVTPVTPLEPPIKVKKPRKPKTALQLEAFKKVAAKRKSIIEQKTLTKKLELSKIYLADQLKKQSVSTEVKPVIECETSSEDSDSSAEIVVKKKSNKKKSKIVIVDSDSDSSDDEREQSPVKKDFGRSHQNKKSIVTVHVPTPTLRPQQNKPTRNYFCD